MRRQLVISECTRQRSRNLIEDEFPRPLKAALVQRGSLSKSDFHHTPARRVTGKTGDDPSRGPRSSDRRLVSGDTFQIERVVAKDIALPLNFYHS